MCETDFIERKDGKYTEIRDCDPAKLTEQEKAAALAVLRKGPSYLHTAD